MAKDEPVEAPRRTRRVREHGGSASKGGGPATRRPKEGTARDGKRRHEVSGAAEENPQDQDDLDDSAQDGDDDVLDDTAQHDDADAESGQDDDLLDDTAEEDEEEEDDLDDTAQDEDDLDDTAQDENDVDDSGQDEDDDLDDLDDTIQDQDDLDESQKDERPEEHGEQSRLRIPASAAARRAVAVIAELTSGDPESIVSIRSLDDRWEIGIEVVEKYRIPDSADILAIYEVELEPRGELRSYRRVSRYARGQLRGEKR